MTEDGMNAGGHEGSPPEAGRPAPDKRSIDTDGGLSSMPAALFLNTRL